MRCTPLAKFGVRRWLFIPRDVYIHKYWGKVTLLKIFSGGKAEIFLNDYQLDRRKVVMLRYFKRGIKSQERVGWRPLKHKWNWQERRYFKYLKVKDGSRIRLNLVTAVYTPAAPLERLVS